MTVDQAVAKALRVVDQAIADRRRQFLSDVLTGEDVCDVDRVDDLLEEIDEQAEQIRANVERMVRDEARG